MAEHKEKIITLIRQKGPCLPSDIYRELETNQLFASAMLGELVSSGTLKVSKFKRSSSPYYYLEDEKDKLQNISNFLNEKDKMAYNLIKEKKILRDDQQTPLIRVTLRSIKDFAIPIQINNNGQVMQFWKWYMITNQEAEQEIKIMLGIIKPTQPEIKPEKELEAPKSTPKLEQSKELPLKEKKQEPRPSKKEEQTKIQTKPESKPTKKPKNQKPKSQSTDSSPFINQINSYFKKNNIEIIEQEIKNTKKTEIDFIIELPSAVGKLQYYCKAKSKKKINDSDIASAFVQGQQKKLPVIFLITGDMTKKSEQMLEKEFKGLKIHKI